MTGVRQQSNFSQLKTHDEQLERLGLLAERYFADDPNTCLLKLRQLTEGMAQSVASRVGIYTSADERQIDLLRRLQDHGILPREVGGLFHEVRKAGNDANHNLAGEHRTALLAMRLPAIGRDVSQQGHWGTGDVELSLTCQADLDMAKPLILMSYQGRGMAGQGPMPKAAAVWGVNNESMAGNESPAAIGIFKTNDRFG